MQRPAQYITQRGSKLEVYKESLTSEISEHWRSWGGKPRSQGMEDTRRICPPDELNKSHLGSQRLMQQARSLNRSAQSPLVLCYDSWYGVLLRLLTVVAAVPLTILSALETPFLLLGCLSNLKKRAFVMSYRILFCIAWLPSSGDLFFSEDEKEGEWFWENHEVEV